jgi:hypothetical protein
VFATAVTLTPPLFFLPLAGPPAGAAEHAGRSPKHVVLVDWDGFDPAFLDRAP